VPFFKAQANIHAPHLLALAAAHLVTDNLEEAAGAAQTALELSVRRHERAHEAEARRLLGEIAARREPPDAPAAEARYREALAQAGELGMRPLQAHCHLGLGKLYRRIGRSDEARPELSTAVAMLREMEMTFWLPEAGAELAAASSSPVT